MANSKEPSSFKSMAYNGKNSLLPPKSPFPSISPSYAEYIPISAIAPKALPKPREGNSYHHRTSSESFLSEEQPSWLDELLNEPETPVHRRGHRRSSSDSFAYTDLSNAGSMSYVAQDDNKFKNLTPVSAWGSQDFDIYRDVRKSSFYGQLNSSCRTKNKSWDVPVNLSGHTRGFTNPTDTTTVWNGGPLSTFQDADRNPPTSAEKQDRVEYYPPDPNVYTEKISETDTKRAKQQFAQRSRVRKLQYIAELERNVQALQAEGSGVSAELEFLNQQNLILSMENKALKQRLESLTQEQLIKYLEHEVLERELGRLKSLYQQQQQPPPSQHHQKSASHRRANSRDLDQQLAALSLKPKDSLSLANAHI